MLGLTKGMARPDSMTKFAELDARNFNIPRPGLLWHIGTVSCMPVKVPERTRADPIGGGGPNCAPLGATRRGSHNHSRYFQRRRASPSSKPTIPRAKQ